MEAIEFTSKLQDGMIPIPEPYKNWSKKPIRVILLTQELPQYMPISPIEANTWVGCMSGTGQILGDIVSPIDDNITSWEVLAT